MKDKKQVFSFLPNIISMLLIILLLYKRANMFAVVNVAFMCICTVLVILSFIISKKPSKNVLAAYATSGFAVTMYYTVYGADAGFGAFSNCLAGWKSAEHALFAGAGNLGLRFLGNILLILPSAVICALLFVLAVKTLKKVKLQKALTAVLSVVFVLTTVLYLLTMNLRSQPNVERLWEGHDDYLKKVDKATTDNPNVLFILMDDLGYGDVSLNGAIYDTPNIDRIGEEGVNLENFYSCYSVCSPARFGLLTGRYPFRGHADNVIYPTISSTTEFATTRLFNSFEMGANCDGMLGDEITIAEVFQNAGYNTGAFGKWHLGDYGEYLPTNQGFDYFYGSHHVNDMTPFYHVKEEAGEYEIVHGYDELEDQSNATKWIHEEITQWVTDTVTNSDEPFFAYYASPWPHGPVYAGDDFDGTTGMGTYVDCVTEFDYYLGELFATLEELGVMDDTIIVFTSDNGPALEGSVNELRGGKYLAYEGGQKVPFMIRWGNNDGLWDAGTTLEQSAVLVDLFPTLIDLCSVTGNGGQKNYLPTDRQIDGVSMLPLLSEDKVIHTPEVPILHMKREKIKAIQYTVPTADVLAKESYKNYDHAVLKDNENVTFKYFKNIQNDNSAFFDKYRKNWLHILTDDVGENYNRTTVYPEIADEMNAKMDEVTASFKENRRGINYDYYNK
ncbi:MAG: sulfatase-like hydrolase/transferase [Clostridia bacterium]|nr:sulfatase-like hydrolase/transferase [Clostridia bacterium]